ncbi:MAG: Holliday junction branch migration protein RuvA [Candidatus Saccharimonadales bacterium]
MIATLAGIVSEKLLNIVVLDVGGVGYGLFVTSEDYDQLSTGEQFKVYIYEHIREVSHDLFGFARLDSKKLFEQLLSVKNVGPKVALAILDIGSGDAVRGAIAAGDVSLLQSAKGVGKRAAEQVVVELKDKVGLAGIDLAEAGFLQSEQSVLTDEAAEALVNLGYSPQDAVKSLQNIDKNLSTEERIKLALKGNRSNG